MNDQFSKIARRTKPTTIFMNCPPNKNTLCECFWETWKISLAFLFLDGCVFNHIHNLEKYLKPLSRDRVSVRADIDALQTAQDQSTFLKAAQLFVEKWRVKQPELVAYSEEEWLKRKCEWCEGAGFCIPSTNNVIEGTNKWIKREHTLRERLPVNQFLNNVAALLVKWSKNKRSWER